MPRDVATRWNSTYDMLVFAVEHKEPLMTILSDVNHTLVKYQLSTIEWGYAEELRDALQVCTPHITVLWNQQRFRRYLKMQPFFFRGTTQPLVPLFLQWTLSIAP